MRPKIIARCTKLLAKSGAEKGVRINGRGLRDFRNFKISFGKSYGSCEVVFEPGTRVFVQVSASIGEPMDSRPGEGALTVSVWISPAATGEMGGSGSQKPAIIARVIERMFKENRALDLESLCIKFGEYAWILRADVHIIDTNGCLSEAASLAVLGALLTFRRAKAFIDPESKELVVCPIEESTPIKLHLFHLPILTSFAMHEGNIILAEPDQEEEEIFVGKLTIGLNDSKELCFMNLTNHIEQDVLMEATKLAEAKCLERIRWLKKQIETVNAERDVPLYLIKEGVRKTGTVIEAKEIENLLSKLYQPSSLPKSSKHKTVKKEEKGLIICPDEVVVLDVE